MFRPLWPCGKRLYAPGAEELAFNSQGACKRCDGTGIVRIVDEATLVPDESLSIDEGAVAPWQTLMWSLMKDIARTAATPGSAKPHGRFILHGFRFNF